jgi:hypothetical protein
VAFLLYAVDTNMRKIPGDKENGINEPVDLP